LVTKKSQRAAEVKRTNTTANTSCSIFAEDETTEIFHILVDIGDTIKSVEKGISQLGFNQSKSSLHIPNALLLIMHMMITLKIYPFSSTMSMNLQI